MVLNPDKGGNKRMIRLSIFLILIIVPCTVFADCKITDTPYKFEVVCSGYNPMYPSPTVSKKKKKTAKRSRRVKKADFEDKERETPTIVMSAEESQFMQTRNRQDGYRGKRNLTDQTIKKTGARENHNT